MAVFNGCCGSGCDLIQSKEAVKKVVGLFDQYYALRDNSKTPPIVLEYKVEELKEAIDQLRD